MSSFQKANEQTLLVIHKIMVGSGQSGTAPALKDQIEQGAMKSTDFAVPW